MKRLWTPADFDFEPYVWIRAEDQGPDFYNVITKLVDVNGNIKFVTDDNKPIYGFVKIRENGTDFLTTGIVSDNCPLPSSGTLRGSFDFIEHKKAYDLLNKGDVSVCFCAKSNYEYYNSVYFTGGASNTSYPMFYITIRQDGVSLNVFPKGSSTGGVNNLFNINCQNGIIVCGNCSMFSEKMNLRGNGSDLGDVSFSTTNHQYPYNNSNFYTDRIGSIWNSAVGCSEIIVYDRLLVQSDYEKIEGYLAWKNNYVELLPSGHPYKESPPEVEIPNPEPTPVPESASSITVPSNPVLFVSNINTRIGDTRLTVGGIPFYNLEAPKDSYTGKTVSGTYKYYGTDKFITVPKDTSSMYISTLFVPDNQVKYGITPCQVLLKFN